MAIGGIAWAQEDVYKDVTSTYIQNADFEDGVDDSKQKKSPTENRPIYCPQSWVLNYDTGFKYDGTALNSSHTTIWNNVSTAAGKLQNGGSNTYMVRFTSQGSSGYTTLTLTQAQQLPKGKYKISADCYFETGNTSNSNSRFIVNIGGSENTSDMFTSGTTWTRQEYTFETDGTKDIVYGVRARKNRPTNTTMVAGYDNFKLEFNLTEALKDAVTDASNAMIDGDESGDATTLDAAIEAAEAKYYATVDEIEAQITAINGAKETYLTAKAQVITAKAQLSAYITRAQKINSIWSDNNLSSQITSAQGVVADGNASVSEVNTTITNLNNALPSNTIAINNADFNTAISSGDPIKASVYSVNSWTPESGNEYSFGQAVTYSTVVNNSTAPATDMYGNEEGNALFLNAGWGNKVAYGQELPALNPGKYIMYYEAYNGNTNKAITSSFFGVNNIPADAASAQSFYSNTMSFNSNEWTVDAVEFTLTKPVVASTANVKVGLTGGNGINGTGACAKLYVNNVALYYLGYDAEAALEDMQTTYDTADGIKGEPMNATVKTALDTKMTAAQSVLDAQSPNDSEIWTANAELKEALSAAQTSISNYSAAKTFIDAKATTVGNLDQAGQDSYNNDATVSTVTAGYDNKTLEVLSDGQKAEMEVALITAVKAQTTNGADFSLLIKNPSFENNWDGWTTHNYFSRENNSDLGKTGSWYASAWHQGTNNCRVEQTIEGLPAGKYRLTVYAAARNQTKCSVYIGSNSVWPGNAQNYTVDTYIDDNADVNIGASCQSWADADSWLAVDNFRLTLIEKGDPAIIRAKDVLLPVIESAPSETANVGTGVFQIPVAAATTYAAAKEAAQNALDDAEATAESLTTAKETLEDAITAFHNALIAPAAGKKYSFTLGGTNSWAGKAITYIEGGRNDHGRYAVSYETEPNSNFAQAFTMTQVAGNQYKMSQTDVEGNERYLCTGTVYGGNNNQIRTTTNSEDALVVEIVPTNEEGIYNIKNTAANANIGSKDNGVYTKDGNGSYVVDFSIAEAAKASANFVITAAKYGTFIAPFNAEKPEGVTLYTCASVENEVLTLEEADAIVANTPYIVYSESVVNETLEGWGLAKQGAYTEGLLTGAYATTDVPEGSYILLNGDAGVGFYVVDAHNTYTNVPKVNANRCYLTAPAGSKARAFRFDGDATGIQSIEVADDAAMYNVSGVRVNSNYKGIVIKGGKKYFVK